MTKPVIISRTVKAAPLDYAELDTNFENLRNATITVSDGVNSSPIDLNGTITFAAGTGIDINESEGTVTITSEGGLDYSPVNNIVNIDFSQTATPTTVTLQDGFTQINGDIKNLGGAEIRLELRNLTRNKTHYCVVRRAQTAGFPTTGTLTSDWRYNTSGSSNAQNSNGIRVWEFTVIERIDSATGVFVKATTQNIDSFVKYVP